MKRTEILPSDSRVPWIDAFRGVMAFLIVWGHCIIIESASPLYRFFYTFHVQAFFFISGYCFSEKKEFFPFLKRKAYTLLLPYGIFALVSILLYLTLFRYTSSVFQVVYGGLSLKDCLLGAIYANPASGRMEWNFSLWFLPCLFVCQLVFYPFARFWQRLEARGNTAKVIGAVAAMTITGALSFLINEVLGLSDLPWGLEAVATVLPYIVCGFVLRRFRLLELRKKWMLPVGLILIAAEGFAVWFDIERTGFFGIIGFAFLSQFLCLRGLRYMGRHAIEMLVLQHFFGAVVLLHPAFSPLLGRNELFPFLSAVLITLLTLGLGWLIAKPAPFTFGYPVKQSREKMSIE